MKVSKRDVGLRTRCEQVRATPEWLDLCRALKALTVEEDYKTARRYCDQAMDAAQTLRTKDKDALQALLESVLRV